MKQISSDESRPLTFSYQLTKEEFLDEAFYAKEKQWKNLFIWSNVFMWPTFILISLLSGFIWELFSAVLVYSFFFNAPYLLTKWKAKKERKEMEERFVYNQYLKPVKVTVSKDAISFIKEDIGVTVIPNHRYSCVETAACFYLHFDLDYSETHTWTIPKRVLTKEEYQKLQVFFQQFFTKRKYQRTRVPKKNIRQWAVQLEHNLELENIETKRAAQQLLFSQSIHPKKKANWQITHFVFRNAFSTVMQNKKTKGKIELFLPLDKISDAEEDADSFQMHSKGVISYFFKADFSETQVQEMRKVLQEKLVMV